MVADAANHNGWKAPVLLGLRENNIIKMIERVDDFLYVDHSYFMRGWNRENFRITRGWCHMTKVVKRPDDRMKKFDVQIEPWRKTGSKVVVIPPTEWQWPLGCYHWTENTASMLKQITDRPIVVKNDKGNLRDFLNDAWAVVTWASVAGVEAALMGIPVFASDRCPSFPVSAGPLENIETPHYAENRHEWACSLAYASWNSSELGKIQYKDYDYQVRDNVS